MKVAGLMVVLALILACGMSYAQQVETGPNVLLKAGALRPFDSETRDVLGSTWYDLGLEFRVASGRKIDHYVGVGWMNARGKTFEFDADFNDVPPDLTGAIQAETDMWIIPLTYTQRTRPNPRNKLYVGGGAGIYFSRGKLNVTIEDEEITTVGFRKSDTNIGVFALGGVAFTDAFRMELKYTAMLRDPRIAEVDGLSLEGEIDGLSLSLVAAY